jgi:hypothetical protein
MDDLIAEYINSEFHGEMIDEIIRSFNLLEDFNYPDRDITFIRLLIDSDKQTPEAIRSLFIGDIYDKINEVLIEHTIKIDIETTLWQRNEFLSALFDLQFLIDYSFLIPVIDSNVSDEEFLGEFFSQLCQLTASDCFNLITEFDSNFITLLKKYIIDKTKDAELIEQQQIKQNKILDHYKTFLKFCNNNNLIGQHILEASIPIGRLFSTYFCSFKKELLDILGNNNEDLFILNILSIIYLSNDGYKNPLICYRANSHYFFSDIDIISKMDVKFTSTITKFEAYKTGSSPPTITNKETILVSSQKK